MIEKIENAVRAAGANAVIDCVRYDPGKGGRGEAKRALAWSRVDGENGFMKSGFPCATKCEPCSRKAAFLQGPKPFRDTMVGFSIHGSIRTGCTSVFVSIGRIDPSR